MSDTTPDPTQIPDNTVSVIPDGFGSVWYLAEGYPVDAARAVEQPIANITGKARLIIESNGTKHVVEPHPASPYAPGNQ